MYEVYMTPPNIFPFFFADSEISCKFANGARRTRFSRRSVMLPTCEMRT